MFSNRAKRTILIGGLGLAVITPTVTVAASSPQERVVIRGTASVVDEGWRYTLSDGSSRGRPFNGPMFGSLKPATGDWPTTGTCKTGDGSIVVEGSGRKEIVLIATGDVCRMSDDSALAFVGSFDTYGSTPSRLDDIQGTIDVRISNDGHVLVTAIEA